MTPEWEHRIEALAAEQRLEQARILACRAVENLPVTNPVVSAAVMLKYRSVVAYNGPWDRG